MSSNNKYINTLTDLINIFRLILIFKVRNIKERNYIYYELVNIANIAELK